MRLDHSVVQIIPLTLKDLSEQRLHLIVDSNSNAHLYPKSPDALDVFLNEMPNLYFYSVDILANVIRGYSLQKSCDIEGDEYCFSTKELWSIIFPSDSERIAISETRKMNEVCSFPLSLLFMEYFIFLLKLIIMIIYFWFLFLFEGCSYTS